MIDDKQVTKNDFFRGTFLSYSIVLQQIKQLLDSGHIHGRAGLTITKGKCKGKWPLKWQEKRTPRKREILNVSLSKDFRPTKSVIKLTRCQSKHVRRKIQPRRTERLLQERPSSERWPRSSKKASIMKEQPPSNANPNKAPVLEDANPMPNVLPKKVSRWHLPWLLLRRLCALIPMIGPLNFLNSKQSMELGLRTILVWTEWVLENP